MKSTMLFAVTLSVQLLLGATSSSGQINRQTAAVLKQDKTVCEVGTNPKQPAVNAAEGIALSASLETGKQTTHAAVSGGAATNSDSIETDNLEWTGQYAERFLRIPEGNSGKPKLIRFLIPVYREKSTKPEASVGTEDKQRQVRQVAEFNSAK